MVEMSTPMLLMCCANCSTVILLRSAMPLHHALDLVVGDLDADPLGLLQLQALLDQLLLRFLLELAAAARRSGSCRSPASAAPWRTASCAARRWRRLLARLAGIGAYQLVEDGAAPCRLVLSALHQRLEVRLQPARRALAFRAMNVGALLDLVAGDRLVVDEHDDGLLGLAGGSSVGLGRRRLPRRPGAACACAVSGPDCDRRRDRTCVSSDGAGEGKTAGGELVACRPGRDPNGAPNSGRAILPPEPRRRLPAISTAQPWHRHGEGVS